MEHCQFSETQFSFCFTFDFIKQFYPFVPLPIFPNTVVEGRAGGGYDVQIQGNVFFQFKIPTYHDRVSNFFRLHWKVYSHDYYKIKLNTDGEQFRLLKDLQSLKPTNLVYYATPEFWESSILSVHYSADRIFANSALFPLSGLPKYGSGHHHLIYSPKHAWGRLFSQPRDIKKAGIAGLSELMNSTDSRGTIYSQAILISGLLREFSNSGVIEFNPNNRTQLVKNVYTTLLTQFNIHWYPITSFL